MPTEEILTCRDLTVGYEDCRLCGEINFSVNKGDSICVVGHSGIGKSALVSTVMGIEKPICGIVKFGEGVSVRNIGCLPQESDFRGASVVQDIVISGCLGRMNRIFVGRAEKNLAHEKMKSLGIDGLSKRRFGDLSGGQQQKVLLARALCAASHMLILDEPVHGLDAYSKEEMYEEIERINKEEKIAVLMVDNESAHSRCEKILHLSDRQLYFGDRSEYFDSIPGQFFAVGRII